MSRFDKRPSQGRLTSVHVNNTNRNNYQENGDFADVEPSTTTNELQLV
jgi:hypothetical protein